MVPLPRFAGEEPRVRTAATREPPPFLEEGGALKAVEGAFDSLNAGSGAPP